MLIFETDLSKPVFLLEFLDIFYIIYAIQYTYFLIFSSLR